LWTRINFYVEDPDYYDCLILKMRYEDGYIAYLNGTEIVKKNLTGTPTWDSMADDGYNTYQIKKYAGHSKIETAMFYVELSQKDFEQAIRKRYGRSDRKHVLLQPKKCRKCGYINRSFHTRCRECSKVLDPEEAIKELKERSDLIASVMPEEMLDKIAELVAKKLKQGKTKVTEYH